MQRASSVYQFGRFHLDATERRLSCDGEAIALTPKVFDTLLTLVQHSGHVLTKDELMRAVWPDGFVEEINLASNISILRKVLADGQPDANYIETVPKVGYRFVASVREQAANGKTHPSNLPTQLTRFIGRERELAEVAQAMTQHRFVTLVGAAGMGKTRLAIEAGKAALNEFADGVWLTEFAPLNSSAPVAQSVLAALRLPEQTDRQPIETLTAFLAEKHALLILDNCEHVIEASARLAVSLLHTCPELHVLTTSREGLRVSGEVTWHVPPLSLPDTEAVLPLERMADFDAVQLFAEHVALSQPDFVLAQDNLMTVAHICQRLDGMPLAIEMAAALVAFLGLSGVASGLDDRLNLLTVGSRTSVRHQQTLRATLDWSYNLLAEPERALLARLSVFAGGWTAEASNRICESSVDLLLQLVRKSLVVVSQHDGQPRYRLLETIRHYADEKLRERDEHAQTCDRHLDYFLDLAEEPIELAGPRVDPWLRRMDAEFDNVRAAFAWAMSRADEGESALRLTYGMTTFSYHHGGLAEFRVWSEQAWLRGQKAPVYARARGLLAKGCTHMLGGTKSEGIRLCSEALALFRQTDDRQGLADCLEVLANNSFDDHVQAYAEELLPLSRELGSRDGEGRALRALGTAAMRRGDRAHAAQLFEQSIAVANWDASLCLWFLYQAAPKRALELCAHEWARLNSSSEPQFAAAMLEVYGVMLLTEGNHALAKRILEEAVWAWEQVGMGQRIDPARLALPLPVDISELGLSRWGSVVVDFGFIFHALGFVELLLGNPKCAWMRLQQAHAFARQRELDWLEVLVDLLKTSLKFSEGQTDAALPDAIDRLRRFYQLGKPIGTVFALCALVQLAGLSGRHTDVTHAKLAARLLGAAELLIPKADAYLLYLGLPVYWLQWAKESIIVPTLAAARAALGDAEFEAAYAEGRRMTLDEAVALALAV